MWNATGHSGPAGMIASYFTNAVPGMGNYSGVELPSHTSAYGGYYPGDLGTRGLVGWLALVFIDHFDYTQNTTFMRDTTYPLLLEAGAFFESYLAYNTSTQMFNLDNACALEGCTLPGNPKLNGKPQRNVAMTLGWIKATFRALVRFSTILGIDEARRGRWEQIVDNLAPFPTTLSANETVFDEAEQTGDFGGNARYPVVNFGHIHPAAQITRLSSSEEDLRIAQATVEQINAINGWVPENGLCMAWPPAAMVTANASDTMEKMGAGLERIMSNNFVPQILGGCPAENAGATQAINDLLLQSYDGVLQFFPAGWDTSLNASFAGLRARGAFVVAASWSGSSVDDGITVWSEAGSNCTFVNPFQADTAPIVHGATTGSPVVVEMDHPTPAGPAFRFETTAGQGYVISRR